MRAASSCEATCGRRAATLPGTRLAAPADSSRAGRRMRAGASSGFVAGAAVGGARRGRGSAQGARRGAAGSAALPASFCIAAWQCRRPPGPAPCRAGRRRPWRSRPPWPRFRRPWPWPASLGRRQLGEGGPAARGPRPAGLAQGVHRASSWGFRLGRRGARRLRCGRRLRCAGILPASMSSYQ